MDPLEAAELNGGSRTEIPPDPEWMADYDAPIWQAVRRAMRSAPTNCPCGAKYRVVPEPSQWDDDTGEWVVPIHVVCTQPTWRKVFGWHPIQWTWVWAEATEFLWGWE